MAAAERSSMEAAAAVDLPLEVVEFQPVLEGWTWTEAKWAKETDARHEYVMVDDTEQEDFHAFYRMLREHGYKAKWTNPVNNKTYYNRYIELGEWTYWWVPRCMNREHVSVRDAGKTLRTPASAAEANAQLSL
jgi:hypothetical protein